MDRLLLACIVFSLMTHILFVCVLPSSGVVNSGVAALPELLEVRYFGGLIKEPVGDIAEGSSGAPGNGSPQGGTALKDRDSYSFHSSDPGDGSLNGATIADNRLSSCGSKEQAPQKRILNGSGEMMRSVTRELRKPLRNGPEEETGERDQAIIRYKKQLENILESESRLVYPRMALANGQEARLHIRFCLKRDGTLGSVYIPPNASGFDQELVAGLKKAASHFPPIPDKIKESRLMFCWPVNFNLN